MLLAPVAPVLYVMDIVDAAVTARLVLYNLTNVVLELLSVPLTTIELPPLYAVVKSRPTDNGVPVLVAIQRHVGNTS